MPLREDLLNPIPGENPAGANLRYDPVTDKIKEARREDLDVPQGDWKTELKTADYNQVIKLTGDALAKRSKDLQLAVWLVDAHVRKEGFSALAPGFRFLGEMLEQYWDHLYPPLEEEDDLEVRAAPLEWLGNKLGEPLGFIPIVSNKLSWVLYQESRVVGYEDDADTSEKEEARRARIADGKITAEQFDEVLESTPLETLKKNRDLLTEGLAELESLAELCDSRFGSSSPSFIKTRSAMEDIHQGLKILMGRKGAKDEAPADEESAEAAPDTDDAESQAAPEEAVEEAVESGKSSWDAGEDAVAVGFGGAESAAAAAPARAVEGKSIAGRLAAVCRAMRDEDPEDAAPYLILRSYAWARMQQNAPLLDHSLLEAPPGELRVNLRRAAKEEDWDRVLELTESAMLQPCGKTWLDLQRYATKALEQKGYASTARVVNYSLRVLLESVPDLVEATLDDDTPVANTETNQWIQNFVLIQQVPRERGDAEETASTEDSSSTDYSLESTETSSDSSSSEFPSFDIDTSTEEATPEAETPAEMPAEEPKDFVVDETPPILDEESAPSDISDEFTNAMRAIRRGTTEDGLQIITALMATERSGRARFRRRTQLAHLLLAAGKGAVALPILDQIAGEIEERRLEDWEESEALAYPLDLLLQCLGRADEERKASLYARICKLDPVRALRCNV